MQLHDRPDARRRVLFLSPNDPYLAPFEMSCREPWRIMLRRLEEEVHELPLQSRKTLCGHSVRHRRAVRVLHDRMAAAALSGGVCSPPAAQVAIGVVQQVERSLRAAADRR